MGFMRFLLGSDYGHTVPCPRCGGTDCYEQGKVKRATTMGPADSGTLYGCLGCGLAYGVAEGRMFRVGERGQVPHPPSESHAPDATTSQPKVVPFPKRDSDLNWPDD